MAKGKEKRTIKELMSLDSIALNQMVKEYPFSASLHAMLAKKNRQQGDLAFEESLRQAAIRARSRAKMQQFIYDDVEPQEEIIDTIESQPEIEVQQKPESSVDENSDELDRLFMSEALAAGAALDLIGSELSELNDADEKEEEDEDEEEEDEFDKVEAHFPESSLNPEELDAEDVVIPASQNQVPTSESIKVASESLSNDEKDIEPASNDDVEDSALEDVPDPVAEPRSKARFSDWLSDLAPEAEHVSEQSSNSDRLTSEDLEREEQLAATSAEKKEQAPKKPAQDIISSFLANEEKIVPKRAEFFSATRQAKLSLTDKDDIVSETLARVYEGQGEYPKAISTYEKLSLLYPEKSSYFAALIEEVKKKQKQ